MAILVTGGAGYIGSHTVLYLQKKGEEVIVLDSLEKGHFAAVSGVPFYQGRLQDSELIEQIFTKHSIEAVIHFAASSLVGESVSRPFDYYENNVFGTFQLLQKNERARHWTYCLFFNSGNVRGA